MNALAYTSAVSFASDRFIGATGGAYAFPFFYRGAYFFYFASRAGDT